MCKETHLVIHLSYFHHMVYLVVLLNGCVCELLNSDNWQGHT